MATSDAELIEAYLVHLRWRNRAQTTIDIRRTYLTHLSVSLGPFNKVKSKALQAWMADPSRDLKASSQGTYLACYHSFFEWSLREKRLKKDPTLRIDKPDAKKGEPHPITDTDREKCIANADALMVIWLLMGSLAGCRCCEIATVSRQDIRDHEETLFIAHGKGRKTRHVPLAPALWDAFVDWGQMPAAGRLWDLSPAQMSKAINTYLHGQDANRVDGEPATAHSLRHWFGSKTYQASKDLRLTQILMGHSSPTTTAGYAAADMTQAAGIVGSL